ncbi:hypothetical protein B0T25DRAFT_552410 [Lasiosphaeria hispida]|uniref:NAD(P)-binding protein n=1 Tax=Lasiosphaeria hispida TaxID=260671 RepID=A0AAJ0HCB4_9PEZI|nr:hypothetical protein B0T25DRAFT_552410 [Lasiosphaeria hispida]
MAPLVWLVTGTTSGIGRAVVEEIVARGDKVIASGRKVEERLGSIKSDSLALLELDISAGREAITAAIQSAWSIFGHIDVLLNNAGMSAMLSAEEATDAYIDTMFTVNLFGQMHVTAAILPLLRAQGHGVVAFTSSSTAWTPLPFMSHYAASKAALSAYVESLRKELQPFGIDTVAFECGGCLTHLGQPRSEGAAAFGSEGTSVSAYGPGLMALGGMFASDPMAFMPGDPRKVAAGMVDVVKREGLAAGKPWAVRVILGSDAYDSIKQKAAEILTLADGWKDVSYATDRDGYSHETQKVYLEAVSIIEKE